MDQANQPKYPLLEELLRLRGQSLKAFFTNKDVSEVFETSIRTIQNLVSDGKLRSRKLPGRARFLPVDLEAYIAGTVKARDV